MWRQCVPPAVKPARTARRISCPNVVVSRCTNSKGVKKVSVNELQRHPEAAASELARRGNIRGALTSQPNPTANHLMTTREAQLQPLARFGQIREIRVS